MCCVEPRHCTIGGSAIGGGAIGRCAVDRRAASIALIDCVQRLDGRTLLPFACLHQVFGLLWPQGGCLLLQRCRGTHFVWSVQVPACDSRSCDNRSGSRSGLLFQHSRSRYACASQQPTLNATQPATAAPTPCSSTHDAEWKASHMKASVQHISHKGVVSSNHSGDQACSLTSQIHHSSVWTPR